MHQILNYLYVTGGVLLLFGAAVFVHEFGHYWMARRRGLKVEAFAIGFGPKILSWNRDGIEYSLRWIPAGGFVKLPQMVTSDALEGKSGAEPIPPASPWSKILVAFAGPFMNVVFAFVIACVIYVVGLPVPVNPREIGLVPPDSEEAQMGILPGDVIVAVDGKKVKNGQDIFSATVFARTNVVPVVIERNGDQRKTYNLKLSATNNTLGLKMLNLDLKDYVMIGNVEPNSPAAKAPLKPNDVIISFAGVPIYSIEQLMDLVSKRPLQPSPILVERGRSNATIMVTPRPDPERALGLRILEGKGFLQIATVETNAPAGKAKLMPKDVIVSLAGVPISSREKFTEVVYKRAEQPSEIVIERARTKLTLNITPSLGARIGISFATKYDLQKPGPTPWAKIADVWDTTITTLGALFHSKQTGVGVKDLSGPPGILIMLAAQFNTDYRLALNFLVLLNINLALINLFPVPVLDGGHIMMAIVERVRRRPLSVRFVEWTTTAFALLLISFMLYVSYNDIARRFGIFRAMFHGNTRVEPSEKQAPQPAPPARAD